MWLSGQAGFNLPSEGSLTYDDLRAMAISDVPTGTLTQCSTCDSVQVTALRRELRSGGTGSILTWSGSSSELEEPGSGLAPVARRSRASAATSGKREKLL